MNRISIILVTKASNFLLSQSRTNLFSIRSWGLTEPSKNPIGTTTCNSRGLTTYARNYNTHTSLDSGACKNNDIDTKSVLSYWGVAPSSFTKAVGSVWNCFRVTQAVHEGCEEC